MCKNPISLRNPSIAWNILQDTLNITVPCNHCLDCEGKKRMDWQVRVYYENLRVKSLGGYALFVTLTYHDDKLPLAYVDKSGHASVTPRHRKEYMSYLTSIHTREVRVTETDEILPDMVMSCFSKADVQKFTENCKDAYRRRGEKFGYFITSEYGKYEDYVDYHGRPCTGTSRPHYHGLLFYDGTISVQEAKRVIEDHWSEFGIVSYGDKRGDISTNSGIVSGYGAIGYVCKYLQKSRDNAEQLRQHLLLSDKRWLMQDVKKLNRNFAPFNTQSYGLGLYILERTPQDLLAKGKCYFPMYDKTSKGKKTVKLEVVDLPLYIERKLFCLPQKDTPNRAYIYNEQGVQLKAQRALDHRNQLIHDITDLLDNTNQVISKNVLDNINSALGRQLGDPGYYLRPKDFADDLKRSLQNYSVKSLVDYLLLFHGMVDLRNVSEPLNDQTDHYVQYYLDYLPSIQDTLFKQISAIKLRKDRSSPFKLSDKTEKAYKRNRIYIAPLEKALELYGVYTTVINNGACQYNCCKLDSELRAEDRYWQSKHVSAN